jgi:ABC-type oligopeptide transport system ATPase subunit
VDGLDLEVHRGECFGLLGPNGAGKTTTIEILEGLLKADAGDVQVLGMRWEHDASRLRQRLGIQLQETQLSDKLSVEEILRLFRSFYEQGPTVDQLIASVGLDAATTRRVASITNTRREVSRSKAARRSASPSGAVRSTSKATRSRTGAGSGCGPPLVTLARISTSVARRESSADTAIDAPSSTATTRNSRVRSLTAIAPASQAIADTEHRGNHRRTAGASRLELASQVLHVRVDRAKIRLAPTLQCAF